MGLFLFQMDYETFTWKCRGNAAKVEYIQSRLAPHVVAIWKGKQKTVNRSAAATSGDKMSKLKRTVTDSFEGIS